MSIATAPVAVDPVVGRSTASSACMRIKALTYRTVKLRGGETRNDLLTAIAELGGEVAKETKRCAGTEESIDDYVLSSTILSPLVMDNSIYAQLFRDTISQSSGREVDWLTHAYECAGWGYVMRYILEKAVVFGPRTLLLQIVDVDIHHFTYWLSNDQWGNSGFGICTLVVDLVPGVAGAIFPLKVGAASQANAMVQMGRALRDFIAERGKAPVAIPFFREAARKVLIKCIENAEIQADGYPQFGHSFGSDPWISILLSQKRNSALSNEQVPGRSIVNSLALNGYFSIAEVEFADDAICSLECDL